MYGITRVCRRATGRVEGRGGFTLVEVALALLVISVGIVVVVGLFPAGLQTNKAAIDDTRMAMFAEEVLNGVRAVAGEAPWTYLDNSSFRLPAPAPDLWDPGILSDLEIVPGEVRVNKYVFSSAIYGDADLTAYAMRYRLDFEDIDPMTKGVTLQVWASERGPLLDDGRVFYTEILYNGK